MLKVTRMTSFLILHEMNCDSSVAYPGGFSGCPETPSHDFLNQTGDTVTDLLAPTFISNLNLQLLETPLGPTLDTPLILGYYIILFSIAYGALVLFNYT